MPLSSSSRRSGPMYASVTLLSLLLACVTATDPPVAPTTRPDGAAAVDAPQPPALDTAITSAVQAARSPSDGRRALWLEAEDVARIPTTGSAWGRLRAQAARPCARPDLADQDDPTNVCVLAKALAFARTGTPSYRADVVTALRSIATAGTYNGRALALGRELAAYVVAADLINLASYDATLDGQFRAKLRVLRTTPTTSGPKNLVACHEERPNNWGTMCGASRIAIAVYLGDRADLERAATVFRGYLGDRTAYAGFKYGETDWQCDPTRPVGINPRGCTRYGVSLDGVLPEEQRRGGGYRWPAPQESYVYEGLQGAVTQALLLSRQGYDVWNWSDRALLRAFTWLHTVNKYPASGDDTWQPHVINRAYGTSFPAPSPSRAGKIFGWTDWTRSVAR